MGVEHKKQAFYKQLFYNKMLKSLLFCGSTCLAFNFPLERSIIVYLCIILNYNLKGISYYSTIIDNLRCNLVVLSYIVVLLCILTNNKFSYIKKYLLCNTVLLIFLITFIFSNIRLRIPTRTVAVINLLSVLYITRITASI